MITTLNVNDYPNIKEQVEKAVARSGATIAKVELVRLPKNVESVLRVIAFDTAGKKYGPVALLESIAGTIK